MKFFLQINCCGCGNGKTTRTHHKAAHVVYLGLHHIVSVKPILGIRPGERTSSTLARITMTDSSEYDADDWEDVQTVLGRITKDRRSDH